jgi:hypothetical protein
MTLEPYPAQQAVLPQAGQHVVADHTDETLIVYQAFKPAIADYAVEHQAFGGPHYKHGRMTWIKPGFMWMMYRAGWATKIDQERILRLTITRVGWAAIQAAAVHSSFQPDHYEDHDAWKQALANSEVRLQWDPDHDPDGNKLERKAIQIGLKGQVLKNFHGEYILKIEDITPFVIELRGRRGDDMMVPVERVVA